MWRVVLASHPLPPSYSQPPRQRGGRDIPAPPGLSWERRRAQGWGHSGEAAAGPAVVCPGAAASSRGARLGVPGPAQGPAQQPRTVAGLGRCWQKSAGTGPWACGPRQVSRRSWTPSPQETEHCREEGRRGLPSEGDEDRGHGPGMTASLRTALEARPCLRSTVSPPRLRLRCMGHREEGQGFKLPSLPVTLQASLRLQTLEQGSGGMAVPRLSLQPSALPSCPELPS